MSARNLFLIKLKKDENVNCIYTALNEYMKNNRFGIKFELKGYYDEILDLLDCKKNYFTITDDKDNMECEEIFENYDAFEYALSFSKKEFQTKEREFLYNKLSFLDEIIKIIFQNNNVESIEVYISDQYSILLDDYSKIININNGEFVNSLIKSYEPIEKDNYFGLKTVKFIIKK